MTDLDEVIGAALRDAEEARVVDEHRDDLELDRVLDGFFADLAERGIAVERPGDPLHDPRLVATLTRAYHRAPSVFPAALTSPAG